MKGFVRENQLLSLCGLNCGLCPMFLGKYCGGCGNGNQSCSIARCAMERGNVEYCFSCPEYPCQTCSQPDSYDSFITHQRRLADLEKARSIGIEAYNREQQEKMAILAELLEQYNDGRKKAPFCLAVNLLELPSLRQGMEELRRQGQDLDTKARGTLASAVLHRIAQEQGVELKLRKPKAKTKGDNHD